jgi:tetratricopeptide (TPR) repeat protein
MHAAMYTVGLGGACAALGRYDEAVRHYKLGVGILKETGHRDGVARSQLSYASHLIAMGQRDRARELIADSLSTARALAIPPIEANALALLGAAGVDPERNFARALELNRELEKPGEVMSTLLGFARLRTGQGRADEARAMFEEALALAEQIKAKESATTARVYLGADEFDDAGVSVAGRVECNFVAWKTTGDEAQLAEARRLLMLLRDNAPQDYRESILENVPLHREIMEAWDAR